MAFPQHDRKKSPLETFRERPYRKILVALIAVLLIGVLVPDYAARALFGNLILVAILLVVLAETVRARHNALYRCLALTCDLLAGCAVTLPLGTHRCQVKRF